MSELVIPLDASQVPEGERGQQSVKVAVRAGDKVQSQVVKVTAGKAEVKLNVDAKQALSIAVGPDNVSDEEIFQLQTLTTNVTPRQWAGKAKLALPPIIVTPVWWGLWRRWCRTFVIHGRVQCADGSAVPGAEVHAYDVDFFWWWASASPVAPVAVTDANGNFAMKFRWCCGWWPWWWWKLRIWHFDPLLYEKIAPVLKLNPNLKVREPSPVPTANLIGHDLQTVLPQGTIPASLATTDRITDPSVIPALRERLISVLPRVPEFERLHIWPWWPWTPWLDCKPDIIFRVTQNCGGGQSKTIVNENLFQARWDIPTNLDVTLVANSEACCVPPQPPDPPGDCVVLSDVCGVTVSNIGGNAGAGAPVGYASPGNRDRPFSEVINFSGQFGSSAQADYYELEYSPQGANAWTPVPPASMLDFNRQYFDGTQPWPNQWFYPGFPVKTFGTKNVYESRHHYEATHPPANWGTPFGRTWTANRDLLAVIQTANNFADGTYDFRIVGYQALPNGDLDPSTRKPMDGCGGQQNNLVTLRLDNRIASGPPPGSVHVNTSEPDCGITAVSLGGVGIKPCGAEQLKPNTPLEIDFFVTDNPIPTGHLDHYELRVEFGLGEVKNLLDDTQVGNLTLTALTPGAQVGPDYSDAVSVAQGGARPRWDGGSMRLHIDDASKVFPRTCCYLIRLTAYKRNIVNCNGNLVYHNQTHYSFTVTV
jgi:hypothetical protein